MEKEHLASMIRERIEKYGPRAALRHKNHRTGQWEDISWNSMGEQIQAVAKGLLELGVREEATVGVFSQNRPEWAITDYAIQSVRAVNVPFYATSSTKQAQFIVDDAEIRVMFVGDVEQYERVKAIPESSVEKIIVFSDDVQLDDRRAVAFKDFMDMGRRSQRDAEIEDRLARASRNDLATIIYTSGTTGDPKGVMLNHSNFFHQFDTVSEGFELGLGDVSLCFLPLSHVFERSWSYFVLHQGAVNCYCDDPKKVIEYLQEVKPMAMVAVPRLYEKVHAAVLSNLRTMSSPKQKLFQWAVGVGRKVYENQMAGQSIGPILKVKHAVANRLIFQKIQKVFGGRVRFMISGGAPLSKEIAEFFYSVGILICEGYGLTETSPTITCNNTRNFKFGTVGKVVRRCEVKLSKEGEILVRGDNVTPGYYNNPEATRQSFEDGWFKTGDVGEFDKDGFLRITDRIKDLIITSGGKNVSPQYVQNTILRDEFIEQAVVIGDRRKFLSALIVPAFDALENYAKSINVSYSSREDLVANPDIVSFFEKRIKTHSDELGDYEKIKRFCLLPYEFTLEAGEVTPTMKLKRKVIQTKYSDLIDSMYRTA